MTYLQAASETEVIAKIAAREAVKEWLVTIGIDASDPEAIINLQKDFAYVRTWRRSIETVRTTSVRTAVGVIVTGFLGIIYVLFKGWKLP
jgi:hypothetical protein